MASGNTCATAIVNLFSSGYEHVVTELLSLIPRFHLALFTKDCRNSTASNLLRPPLGTNPSPKLAIDTVSAAILARAQEARQVDNVSR